MPAPLYRRPWHPTNGHMHGVVVGGVFLVFFGIGIYASLPKFQERGGLPGALLIHAAFTLLWLGGLFTAVFPKGLTLADGRVGVARRVFGRTRWVRWRPADDVRRLVVRHSPGTPAELVAWFDDGARQLLPRRTVAELRVMADDLAAALGGVPVTEEDTRFTGTRAERPVYSSVRTDGDTLRLPSAAVEVQRPVVEVKRFGPEFRRNLIGYLIGGSVAGFALLYAGLTAVMLLWAAGELVVTGHTSQHVRVGMFDLAGEPQPLGTRLGLVGVTVLWAVVQAGITGLFGWWLARTIWRSVRRTAARQPATRTVTVRHRSAPLAFHLAADSFTLTRLGLDPTRWAWADLADARAFRVEHTDNGEGAAPPWSSGWSCGSVRARCGRFGGCPVRTASGWPPASAQPPTCPTRRPLVTAG